MQDTTANELLGAGRDHSDELFGHPKGLYICFATELWERFSFYGMKYLLVLYLTKYHLFTDTEGLGVLASYAGLVYAFPVIGGLLADRYLGMKKAVVFGGILLVLGHLGMAYEGTQAASDSAGVVTRDDGALQVFYFSLALIILGVGFLKPNISTIVGQLYSKEDPRRDSGFTIFYMGINIGSAVATLLCGYLGETYGWRYGFGAAGIGMAFGLVTFLWGQKYLHGLAEAKEPEKLKEIVFGGIDREKFIYLTSLVSLVAIWQLVQYEHVVSIGLGASFLLVSAFIIHFIVNYCDAEQRKQMGALMILIVFSILFWSLFEQAGGSLTLFADRALDREAFGFTFTAAQFGSLNAIFIILTAPIFAWLWVKLAKYNLEPNTSVKFSLGLIQAGLGFGVLVLGANYPDESGRIAMIWLILAYFLHTTGELCLSPVGLSAVTKLSVPRVVGFMMGTWFLATALAENVAAQLSKLAAIDTSAGETIEVAQAVVVYTDLFLFLMWVGVISGLVLLAISPLVKKLMGKVH